MAGGAAWLAGRALAAAPEAAPAAAGRMNVLFIAVDDLRPQLGCYGDPVAQSPHLDELAARGVVFTRAYCQQAVCSPSRTSLLTGRRPDTTRVYDLDTHFRSTIPGVVTLPEHFKNHGYHTAGFSKVYHGGLDDAQSWSVPWWKPTSGTYHTPENQALMQRLNEEARAAGRDIRDWRQRARGAAWEAPDVPDNALADGQTADRAIEALREAKDKPFFLGVGFLKPHLPFVAPKRYWDLYRREELSLADNPFAPKNAPHYALSNWGELRHYYGMPKKGPVTDEQARALIHGYYACASYTDAQIGRVIDELDRLGLRDNTVIVVWGDHGWQLGEHGMWCKHTNFETSVHAPLIMSAPKRRAPGATSDALVEFVDIYPSLCEVCGLPLPDGLEGDSFAPLLDEPGRPWKAAAFSQYPRGIEDVGRIMGYSMRTDRYRLTEWRGINKPFTEYELYDHETDPDENENIAGYPENEALVNRLTAQLRAGWQAARPPR
ncbi:MAG: sulfatase [Candidatus Hydrogenedentes bacterium]|nr:sulfatase [Candidatus Hydrogenedentota bacterium]